jgi:hypothetical protein
VGFERRNHFDDARVTWDPWKGRCWLLSSVCEQNGFFSCSLDHKTVVNVPPSRLYKEIKICRLFVHSMYQNWERLRRAMKQNGSNGRNDFHNTIHCIKQA